MARLCLLVSVEKETLDTFQSLAAVKGCTLKKLLGEVLDEYVELGLAEAEFESEVEAQSGEIVQPSSNVIPIAGERLRQANA